MIKSKSRTDFTIKKNFLLTFMSSDNITFYYPSDLMKKHCETIKVMIDDSIFDCSNAIELPYTGKQINIAFNFMMHQEIINPIYMFAKNMNYDSVTLFNDYIYKNIHRDREAHIPELANSVLFNIDDLLGESDLKNKKTTFAKKYATLLVNITEKTLDDLENKLLSIAEVCDYLGFIIDVPYGIEALIDGIFDKCIDQKIISESMEMFMGVQMINGWRGLINIIERKNKILKNK